MRALAGGVRMPARQFKAELGAGGVTDMWIYDYIDSWGDPFGVSAQDVMRSLIGAGDVVVHLNSPGGEVIEGVAIYNNLKNHTGNVEIRVEALAASMGSLIAMAGNTVVIEPSAHMMIHDAWDIAMGNEDELRSQADTLGKVSQTMAGVYALRMGGDADAVRAIMRAGDKWYNAEEALAAGLVDSIASAAPATASAPFEAKADLSLFASAPPGVADPINIAVRLDPEPIARAMTDLITDVPASAGDDQPTTLDLEAFRAAWKGITV
ncbi:MAG TPA: head maturation protease, ClpP-related [Propionibacteriaceae bacterium]|nr:head maturation protease, ClpP-related [Propionibacteriaceae bacterium]